MLQVVVGCEPAGQVRLSGGGLGGLHLAGRGRWRRDLKTLVWGFGGGGMREAAGIGISIQANVPAEPTRSEMVDIPSSVLISFAPPRKRTDRRTPSQTEKGIP